MNRRGFLGTMLAACAAPAIVRAASLMPGKGLLVPSGEIILPGRLGWAAWNAAYIGLNGLWSPEQATSFIAEHNSFADKPFRLEETHVPVEDLPFAALQPINEGYEASKFDVQDADALAQKYGLPAQEWKALNETTEVKGRFTRRRS